MRSLDRWRRKRRRAARSAAGALDRYEDYGGLHGADAQVEAIRDACRLAAEVLRA